MIYAWHDGRRYGVQFQYTKDHIGHRFDTECSIYNLGTNLDERPEICDDNMVGMGVAYLHPTDNFCAEVGRKIALGHALDWMGENWYCGMEDTKALRRAIWQAYHNRNILLEGRQKDSTGRTFDVSC